MRSFFSLRIAIIIFWIAALGLFLLLPSVSSLIWPEGKTLNLFTWAATIDPQIIQAFEKEKGIKVNITYFESNEELFVKLFTTKGKGYDLIIPSDYLMEKLIKYNLIKPVDKKKLNFWERINPRLLDHYFDPGNQYSIPYFWAVYGLGIDKNFFGKTEPPASWSLLFDYPIAPAKVAMLNVAREAMLITAQYLYGSIESITAEKIKKIKEKLIKQKPRVETYVDADVRSNYLLASKTCPVVVSASPYILQLMHENEAIDFLMPKEGSFILIDNLVISSACKKDELVYQLINYLYEPKVVKHHYENYPFLPVTDNLKELMEADRAPASIIAAHFDRSLQLEFFKNVIPEKITNEVWVAVKTS